MVKAKVPAYKRSKSSSELDFKTEYVQAVLISRNKAYMYSVVVSTHALKACRSCSNRLACIL